jgi:glycolate oxidase FAD binding subunit
MLVKNVSGFEIARLLHGSWGSLAVLTSVNLKVVPKPKADLTISRRFDDLEPALAAQAALLQAHSTIAASVVEGDASGWTLHVRLLGREASLRALLAEIRTELGAGTSEQDSDTFWAQHADRWAGDASQVQVVVGGQPRAMGEIAGSIAGWGGLAGMSVSAGTGSLRVRLDPSTVAFRELRDRLAPIAATCPITWLVEHAPPAWKRDGSVWGPTPDGLGVMQSVKREFDPAGVLNRGRLFLDSERR